MELSDVESLVKKRTADLARLVRIAKHMKGGGKPSASDAAWLGDLSASDRGAEGLAEGMVPGKIAAKLLGVTERTLFSMRKEGMPHGGRGEYSLPDVVPWYVARELKKRAKRAAANPETEERLRKEKLRSARRKNDLEEGRLLPASDVVAWAVDAAKELRGELEAVGRAHGEVVMRDILEAVDRFEKVREGKFSRKQGGS